MTCERAAKLPDRGYIRAYASEWVTIDGLAEKPEDAPGDGPDLLLCERVTADDLAGAFDADWLMEQLEQYACDNGLCGEGALEDFYDFVDDFPKMLEAAVRKAVIDGFVKSRFFRIEKIKE